MAGGAVGILVHRIAPFPTGDPGAYALVGMGTLFAGIIRAPMTSVFMIFEITQDYQILVPLMVANMLSFVISRRYQPVPVYHALLRQDGVHLPSAATPTPSASKAVRRLIRNDVTFIPPDCSIEEARRLALAHDAPAYLVGTPERLLGIVRRSRLEDATRPGSAADPIASIVEEAVVHAHVIIRSTWWSSACRRARACCRFSAGRTPPRRGVITLTASRISCGPIRIPACGRFD